jgi:hypothetical protein
VRSLSYGTDKKELPYEVRLAQFLRDRGFVVDRLRLTVSAPFALSDVELAEREVVDALKRQFHFVVLP